MTKNILKQYKKKRRFLNISIIVTSLVFAIGVNIFLFEGSDLGQKLKASIMDSKTNTEFADIYMEEDEKQITVTASKNMQQVKNITFSVTYNPVNVEIFDQSNTTKISEVPGMHTYLLTFDTPQDIQKGDGLLSLVVHKTTDEIENLNIIGANFSDNQGKEFSLSTSGINF